MTSVMMRLLPALLLLGGCASRVAALEARVSQLERALYGPSDAEQQEAYQLYTAAMERLASTDDPTSPAMDEARALLRRIVAEYRDTQAASASTELLSDLEVVGKHVDQITGTTWLQGSGALSDSPVTLLAFWEAWCPHCQREVPKLTAWVDQFGAQGFAVISLTRMSRDTTEAQVLDFAKANGVTFPIGHEDGSMSTLFGVEGIPAAAAVRNGVVVWRGHPAELSPEIIQGWLSPK